MHWPTRTPIILSITTLLAMCVLGAYGWLLREVDRTNTEATLLASTIDTQVLEEEHARIAERLLAETEEEQLELSSIFVTEDSVVSFIELLEALGADADVVTTIASVDTEEGERGPIGTVRVRLQAVGAWRDVMHFATLIDTLPFVIAVREMEFSRSDEEDAGAWQGAFTIGVAMVEK